MAKKKLQQKVQKKTANPFLILSLVIVLSAVGWFIYNYHFLPKERATIVPTNAVETHKILKIAQDGTKDVVKGISVRYVFVKQVGDYALVKALPLHNDTDPLQIVLQEKDGTWQIIAAGTAFPELETILPSGFLE